MKPAATATTPEALDIAAQGAACVDAVAPKMRTLRAATGATSVAQNARGRDWRMYWLSWATGCAVQVRLKPGYAQVWNARGVPVTVSRSTDPTEVFAAVLAEVLAVRSRDAHRTATDAAELAAKGAS